eukprot:scaffold7714_cov133-Isochrysis_galbana.AAC.7
MCSHRVMTVSRSSVNGAARPSARGGPAGGAARQQARHGADPGCLGVRAHCGRAERFGNSRSGAS